MYRRLFWKTIPPSPTISHPCKNPKISMSVVLLKSISVLEVAPEIQCAKRTSRSPSSACSHYSTDILSNTSCCQIQIVLIIVTSSMTESPRQTNNAPRIEPCRKMTCNSTAVTVKGLFPSKGIYNPDREETQRNPI